MPAKIAMTLTFAFSGFVLHDLVIWVLNGGGQLDFPRVTVAFLLISAIVLISEKAGISFSHLRPSLRVLAHLITLATAFGISSFLAQVIV